MHISVPVTVPERGLKIGEAARLLGVEAFVLRFWETQFAILKPRHTRTKHRFYQKRDIEALRLIKRLLHDEGFTIAGANKHIKERGIEALLAGSSREKASRSVVHSAGDEPALDGTARRVLSELRRDLQSLRKMLD
ncbi:MAG TPA: MerR family transcriptional regulator [Candidatus Binataceae bacterium]